MKKTYLFVTISFFLLAFSFVFAQVAVRYDFDDVEASYAAEFTAEPQEGVDPDCWIVQIAGGIDKPVDVLYGVIDLKKQGVVQMSEEFIRVSGEGGSERFLINSAAFDYYEGTGGYSSIRSLFWSAKKVVENSVVKDFTPPVKSIILSREFDEFQQLSVFTLSFSDEGQDAQNDFWSGFPAENIYQADMNTANQAGEATAVGAQ